MITAVASPPPRMTKIHSKAQAQGSHKMSHSTQKKKTAPFGATMQLSVLTVANIISPLFDDEIDILRWTNIFF